MSLLPKVSYGYDSISALCLFFLKADLFKRWNKFNANG